MEQSAPDDTIPDVWGGWWHVRLNSDARIYSDVFGDFPAHSVFAAAPGQDECEFAAEISIGAYTALVFTR